MVSQGFLEQILWYKIIIISVDGRHFICEYKEINQVKNNGEFLVKKEQKIRETNS